MNAFSAPTPGAGERAPIDHIANVGTMITLEQVTKTYGNGTVAVADLSLEIGDGELSVLVGPSGCGKTTTLRMINRLIEPSSGRILIGGENVLTKDPVQMRRGIGYVIQQGGLFPHRRVFDNVAVVPRLLGWNKSRVEHRVNRFPIWSVSNPAPHPGAFPMSCRAGSAPAGRSREGARRRSPRPARWTNLLPPSTRSPANACRTIF